MPRILDEVEIDAAWRLAAFLHQQGLAGRDKVTLLLPKALAGIGVWTKQNFEESLGKSEALGIKIVIGEKIRLAGYPPARRIRGRIAYSSPFRPRAPWWKRRNSMPSEGYPIAVLALDAGAPLSRYMQFLHYTVFGLGYLRSMNFVTQPSVELYKAITSPLARQAEKSGGDREDSGMAGVSQLTASNALARGR